MFTWGDGVSDVDPRDLLDSHRSHGRLATVTAVQPPDRFGRLDLKSDTVRELSEKPQIGEGWINGAFFALDPGVFDHSEGDQTQFERESLERLTKEGQLMAYRHTSFWSGMDTLRDKRMLASLWQSGKAPWKVWN